jgi:hypothetical protein
LVQTAVIRKRAGGHSTSKRYGDSEASHVNPLERCPGCAASYPRFEGATHPSIGASAACWAVHAAVLAGSQPSRALLATSTVLTVRHADEATHQNARVLLLDAYAAQHHGVPSPQAIQSVAVHLLVLHGVLARGVAPEAALWIRRQAVRRKAVYAWLTPPPSDAALSLRHCFPGRGIDRPRSLAAYVSSVYDAWQSVHSRQLDAWYNACVAA